MLPAGLLTNVTADDLPRTLAARVGGAGTAAVLIGLALADMRAELSMVGVALNLVGAGLALAAVVFVPWTRLTPRALLVWPLAVLAVLLVSALSGSEAAALFTGAITLSFLYVGVTQPPGTCLPLLPLAGVTWWLAINLSTSDSIVRLASAVIVWILVAEVPARLLERLYRMGVQLSVRARTDALTGLNNRHDLPRALNALLPGDSLVLLDLDRFKDFNDQYGHQAGDLVLADFGAFLGRTARSSDLAFRYGGEEFLLLLSQTTAAEAQHLVDRAAATWNGQTRLTFSAGIAMATTAGDETALRKADAALYAAKAAGRATSRVHEHDSD